MWLPIADDQVAAPNPAGLQSAQGRRRDCTAPFSIADIRLPDSEVADAPLADLSSYDRERLVWPDARSSRCYIGVTKAPQRWRPSVTQVRKYLRPSGRGESASPEAVWACRRLAVNAATGTLHASQAGQRNLVKARSSCVLRSVTATGGDWERWLPCNWDV